MYLEKLSAVHMHEKLLVLLLGKTYTDLDTGICTISQNAVKHPFVV